MHGVMRRAGCIWLLETGATWEPAFVVEGSVGEGELTLAQFVGFPSLLLCCGVGLEVGLAWQSLAVEFDWRQSQAVLCPNIFLHLCF